MAFYNFQKWGHEPMLIIEDMVSEFDCIYGIVDIEGSSVLVERRSKITA